MRPKWGSIGGAWSVPPAQVTDELDVAAIRKTERLTQEAFAKRYGFAFSTVRDWEQGRRQPDRAARVLLTVIAREPEAVRRALAATKLSREEGRSAP
jgi:DNA-binding transcriptional regulator YiaG